MADSTFPAPLESSLEEKTPRPAPRVARMIAFLVGGCVLAGGLLWIRQVLNQQSPALAQQPKGVGTVKVHAASYRASSRYIGALLPWEEAKVGPQFISAYITQVTVRPGDSVRKGQVLALLEPDKARARSEASSMQVKALEAREEALRKESDRIKGLLKKGIVSINEAEKKLAEANSEQAKVGAAKAELGSSSLEVQDSILRAPFDGEIAERDLDPGAFVRPGSPIVTVVDRKKIRVSADASESDFAMLAPGTTVRLHLLATGESLDAVIARRSPSADGSTRTIHFEIDLANPGSRIPSGTTAEIFIQSIQEVPALAFPVSAANIKGTKATVFVVTGGKVRKTVLSVLGEREGQLFVSPGLPDGTEVVLEGRNQLQDGDPVDAKPAR
jgi:membrane fusion protein, multidrug efflux system